MVLGSASVPRGGVASQSDRITTIVVLAAASVFLALSAYNAGAIALDGRRKKSKGAAQEQGTGLRQRPNGAPASSSSSSSSSSASTSSAARFSAARPLPRPPSDSAVSSVTYVTTPEDCQATSVASFPYTGVRPKIHAGALFKLIDVAAGVAARRHARGPCVTISVDSVILLKPIFLGDIVHVSASVNRAWSTSMEIGVRIVKETATDSGRVVEYVSHSYLTFVAITKPGAGKTTISKPVLAPVKTSSRLESRRHMLAGRRRNRRLENARHNVSRDGVSIAVKEDVRQQVADMLRAHDQSVSSVPPVSSNGSDEERDDHIRAIEIEVVIQAWAQEEPGVVLHKGMIEVTQEGDESLRFLEIEVRRRARELGIKVPGDDGYELVEQRDRGIATPVSKSTSSPFASPRRVARKLIEEQARPRDEHSSAAARRDSSTSSLDASQTLTSTMHLVFPQHTNSHGIIFGGNTMSWSEDIAIMACRSLRLQKRSSDGQVTVTGATWKTVAMDGLEFNVRVGIGELMIFAAIVLRTFERSCEVYVIAFAESLEGERRFANDVLFTMACDDDAPELTQELVQSRRPSAVALTNPTTPLEIGESIQHQDGNRAKIITTICTPYDSALAKFAAAGDARRLQRLQLRDMLVRVYGS